MQSSAVHDDEITDYLFDPVILQDCHEEENAESAIAIRPLRMSDYSRQYLQLLSQLTIVGHSSEASFQKRFLEMKTGKTYYIVVAVDKSRDLIVASTTLFLEYKFIHGNALRGRIEDVVVHESMRGKGLGKLILATATALARKLGCYKLSLDCRDEIIPYYKSLGFTAPPGRANMLVIRFDTG